MTISSASWHQKVFGVAFPTGWAYTDATHYVDCPKCTAPKGFYCVTPKGRKAVTPHGVRIVELARLFPDVIKLSRRQIGVGGLKQFQPPEDV